MSSFYVHWVSLILVIKAKSSVLQMNRALVLEAEVASSISGRVIPKMFCLKMALAAASLGAQH
jgi:hypothetical protein